MILTLKIGEKNGEGDVNMVKAFTNQTFCSSVEILCTTITLQPFTQVLYFLHYRLRYRIIEGKINEKSIFELM